MRASSNEAISNEAQSPALARATVAPAAAAAAVPSAPAASVAEAASVGVIAAAVAVSTTTVATVAAVTVAVAAAVTIAASVRIAAAAAAAATTVSSAIPATAAATPPLRRALCKDRLALFPCLLGPLLPPRHILSILAQLLAEGALAAEGALHRLACSH